MSENDIKLGGIAAGKFTSCGTGVYANDQQTYCNSDQVREHYYKQIEGSAGSNTRSGNTTNTNTNTGPSSSSSNVPFGWEDRQRSNALQNQQRGAFARESAATTTNAPPSNAGGASHFCGEDRHRPAPRRSDDATSAEAALVRVATHALEVLAMTLSSSSNEKVEIPAEERAAFAAAVKRALDAVARS